MFKTIKHISFLMYYPYGKSMRRVHFVPQHFYNISHHTNHKYDLNIYKIIFCETREKDTEV